MFSYRKKILFVFMIGMGVVSFSLWQEIFIGKTDDGILDVYFLDVGQGDSIFVECPNGIQMLIDGGPDDVILEHLSRIMGIHDRRIDILVLTHPDADHITGLVSVLENYDVGRVLISGTEKDSAVFKRWQEVIEEKGVISVLAQAGQEIVMQSGDEEVVFRVLWPDQGVDSFKDDVNDMSVVGQLVYGQLEVLLTGDIGEDVERFLSDRYGTEIQSDVLKVAHHGSKNSSDPVFIGLVDPEIAVLSVGEDNRYGHPHDSTLDRLKDAVIYRTDEHGNVELTSDGVNFEIREE